jgi:glycosyltransferase involved in cell wall biosynthesis
MRHLIVCPEYPPAPIPPGGIGTYALHIARLLAERGETVHVIGQRWHGAPRTFEARYDGRLLIHRVGHGDRTDGAVDRDSAGVTSQLLASTAPGELFAWQAALLAEQLVERDEIDVIEAQEWQGPLYYFQLRRALGEGPARKPPVIVQLHSPTEFIFLHNDWDITRPDYLPARRREDYSISAADAWLCPSAFLARQAEARYGMRDGAIHVIPLPVGGNPVVERDAATWARGSICYIGRLEPRKGVIEWVDAAVAVARDDPTVHFDFIGADLPYAAGTSVHELVGRRIPDALTPRIRFHGEQPRSRLPEFLSRARMAVVPSRWENFPNSCVEAMCSGLPVIASRNGGMAEMIEDGRTGWLADSQDSRGLAGALRRALATDPATIAAMGCEASAAIHAMCDNTRIVDQHLELHEALVRRGAERSLHVPVTLPWANAPLCDGPARRTARHEDHDTGVAFVLSGAEHAAELAPCAHTLMRQTRAPAAVAVVLPAPLATTAHTPDAARASAGWRMPADWLAVRDADGNGAAGVNRAIHAISDSGVAPLGIALLDADDRLHPDFAAACAAILRHCPDVGVVSCWTHDGASAATVRPCPTFPYQWLTNEAVPCSVVRTEALLEVGGLCPTMSGGYERWALVNAVMAAGWAAVTAPAFLAERRVAREEPVWQRPEHQRMRRSLLSRHPDLVARDARDLVLLLEAEAARAARGDGQRVQERLATAHAVIGGPVREQVALALFAARHPRATARWAVRNARKIGRRAAGTLGIR